MVKGQVELSVVDHMPQKLLVVQVVLVLLHNLVVYMVAVKAEIECGRTQHILMTEQVLAVGLLELFGEIIDHFQHKQ